MASSGYGTGCYGTMVGIGTTGGFSIVFASNPWLVARVLAYLRISTLQVPAIVELTAIPEGALFSAKLKPDAWMVQQCMDSKGTAAISDFVR